MARYTKQHKEETRRAILERALDALRARGLEGAGLAEIMARAGLTHGAFYAHFPSKDDLVAAACETGVEAAGEALCEVARNAPPSRRVDALTGAYLTETRRNARERGCPLATLGGEIARSSPQVRRRFTRSFRRSVERLATTMPGTSAEVRFDQALALLAGMIGAMVLARAVQDRDLSDRLLDVGRRALPGALERLDA